MYQRGADGVLCKDAAIGRHGKPRVLGQGRCVEIDGHFVPNSTPLPGFEPRVVREVGCEICVGPPPAAVAAGDQPLSHDGEEVVLCGDVNNRRCAFQPFFGDSHRDPVRVDQWV